MEINYALIGKRIRETRKQRGLSAEELAEIADLSTVYISYIENAKRKPSLESLIKISNALEITIDELLYGNLLYNPTEYQTDIDLLMADCTSTEKRYIFEVLSAIKNILRINDWHLSSKHNYDITTKYLFLHKPSVNHLTDGLCLFQSKNSMIVISTIKDVATDERK